MPGSELFDIFKAKSSNNYNPLSSYTLVTDDQELKNNVISIWVNASSYKAGSLSNFKFDPTNSGTFLGRFDETEDFVFPGSPWEGYGVLAGGNLISAGNNTYYNYYSVGKLYKINNNHVASIIGSTNNGYVITQLMVKDEEPIVRMQISYSNTTGSNQTVKAMRSVDPDQDRPTTFDTYNRYGLLDVIDVKDIVTAEGTSRNKDMALYSNGDGITHNTYVDPDWPNLNVYATLSNSNYINNYADDALTIGFDFGLVAAGETVAVGLYYVVGVGLDSILQSIQQYLNLEGSLGHGWGVLL